jgi:hypothetical protein
MISDAVPFAEARSMGPKDIAIKATECAEAAASASHDADRRLVLLQMTEAWLTLAIHYRDLGPHLGHEYRRLAELQSEIIPTLH